MIGEVARLGYLAAMLVETGLRFQAALAATEGATPEQLAEQRRLASERVNEAIAQWEAGERRTVE